MHVSRKHVCVRMYIERTVTLMKLIVFSSLWVSDAFTLEWRIVMAFSKFNLEQVFYYWHLINKIIDEIFLLKRYYEAANNL